MCCFNGMCDECCQRRRVNQPISRVRGAANAINVAMNAARRRADKGVRFNELAQLLLSHETWIRQNCEGDTVDLFEKFMVSFAGDFTESVI